MLKDILNPTMMVVLLRISFVTKEVCIPRAQPAVPSLGFFYTPASAAALMGVHPSQQPPLVGQAVAMSARQTRASTGPRVHSFPSFGYELHRGS